MLELDPARAVDISASASLVDGGAALRVDYTLKNLSDHSVYVCDELLLRGQGGVGAGKKAVVLAGRSPGEVALVCGAVSPLESLMALPEPSFRELAAGATMQDYRQVPYPLESWNNVGSMNPLPAGTTSLSFAVEILTAAPTSWAEVPLKDGRSVRVPNGRSGVEIARVALPLP